MTLRRALAALLVALALPAAAQVARPSQPEPPSGWAEKKAVHAPRSMVAAASPLAVDAGLRMLAAGGTAVDAAIAVQLVLTLVEPHASGLGGGAFLLFYDVKSDAMAAYDGRETAPAAATPDLLLQPDGKPMPFREAVTGGRAVGVPGLVRLLAVARERHGRLDWKTLAAPAIALAENGFPLSPRVHRLLGYDPCPPR